MQGAVARCITVRQLTDSTACGHAQLLPSRPVRPPEQAGGDRQTRTFSSVVSSSAVSLSVVSSSVVSLSVFFLSVVSLWVVSLSAVSSSAVFSSVVSSLACRLEHMVLRHIFRFGAKEFWDSSCRLKLFLLFMAAPPRWPPCWLLCRVFGWPSILRSGTISSSTQRTEMNGCGFTTSFQLGAPLYHLFLVGFLVGFRVGFLVGFLLGLASAGIGDAGVYGCAQCHTSLGQVTKRAISKQWTWPHMPDGPPATERTTRDRPPPCRCRVPCGRQLGRRRWRECPRCHHWSSSTRSGC